MDIVEEFLLRPAERSPDKTAVIDPGRSLSYAELWERVANGATLLRSLGLQTGERCLVILPNSVDFIIAHFAVLAARLISVPCDAEVNHRALADICDNGTPAAVVTDRDTYLEHQERLSRLDVVLVDEEVPGTSALSSASGSASDFELPSPRGDVACLMYTTGTTGHGKGVRLSHENITTAVRNICTFVGYTSEDTEVVVLPLSHSFGLGHVYCNLRSGGTVYTEPGLRRIGRVLKAIERLEATGFPTTPSGVGLLLDRYAEPVRQKCASLRFSVINSAPLPPEHTRRLQALLPDLDILVYYGLTEASRSTFISLSRSGETFYSSVGKPMPGVTIETVDPAGRGLPPGEVGEITIRGATVSDGYWRNEEETRRSFAGAVLKTGDLGYLDDHGHLFVTGRLKEQINVGGYKVNPAEVEQVLGELAAVHECAVFSSRTRSGESIAAAVVVTPGSEVDFTVFRQHCFDRLESWKVPVQILSVSEIPKTSTGKVKRQTLTATYSEAPGK